MEESYQEAEESKNEKFATKSKETNEKKTEKEASRKGNFPPQNNPQLSYVPMQAPVQFQNFATPQLIQGNSNLLGIQQLSLSNAYPSYSMPQYISQPQTLSFPQSQIISQSQQIIPQNQNAVNPLPQGIYSSITPKPVSQNQLFENPINIPQQNQIQTIQNVQNVQNVGSNSNNILPLQQNRLLRQYTPKLINMSQQPIFNTLNQGTNDQMIAQVSLQGQAYYPNYQQVYLPYQNYQNLPYQNYQSLPYQNYQGQYYQQQYGYPTLHQNTFTTSNQAYVNSSMIQPNYVKQGQYQYY